MEAHAAAGVRRAIEAHFGSHQVARVVYGAIIGMALVVSLQQHPPAAGVVAGSLLATAFAVALAELYSDVVGSRIMHRGRVTRNQFAVITKDVAAVAFGISFPAIFFILAAAGALELDTAFDLAKWSGVLVITFYAFCAARLSGERLAVSLLQALGVGLIGVALIVVKSLLH
jgi:hypothetical protein